MCRTPEEPPGPTGVEIGELKCTQVSSDFVKRRISQRQPLHIKHRLAETAHAEEIAKVVRFIVTEATYMTGSTIDVNGGMYYR
mgnify:CR=1 FL=1